MAHGREDTCSRTATGRNQQVLDRRAQASPVLVLASLEATRYCDNWRGASGREQSPSRKPPRGARTPPRPFSPTSCAHRASLSANGRERTRSIRSERASSRLTIACTRRRSPARTLPASSQTGDAHSAAVSSACRGRSPSATGSPPTGRAGTTAPSRLPPCRARLRDVHAAARQPRAALISRPCARARRTRPLPLKAGANWASGRTTAIRPERQCAARRLGRRRRVLWWRSGRMRSRSPSAARLGSWRHRGQVQRLRNRHRIKLGPRRRGRLARVTSLCREGAATSRREGRTGPRWALRSRTTAR